MDNKEIMQKFKKELVRCFITAKGVTNTHPINVSLSFYSYGNMVTLNLETSQSINIVLGGLEMTLAIADAVMEDLGFTKLKSPYTGYGERGVYLYCMN